jgi:anti-sigma factor RsiW
VTDQQREVSFGVNCTREMGEPIHRYLDEEMTVSERQEFEDHLASCSACMTDLRELGVAIQKVMTVEWMKAPADFTETLMQQISTTYPPKRNWQVPLVKYTGIAAAVLLVFGTGLMMAQPRGFSLQAKNPEKLQMAGAKVIVPAGSVYNGDITITNGELEVRGKVNGNVVALNSKVQVDRALGADISGETEEVDQALEKLVYYGKELWHSMTDSIK